MHDKTGDADQGNAGGGGTASETPEPLGTIPLREHDRAGFVCPKSARVEGFLRNDCIGLIQQRYCSVFVWPDPDNAKRILGFYSLSHASVQRPQLNNNIQRKAPKGIPAPVMLIGYMGRDETAPKGLGGVLILDAARRVARQDVAAWGLALHAENDQLAAWYVKQGFIAARDEPRLMYAPLSAFPGAL